MKFIPNSSIKNEMLKEIGIKKIDDLFKDIPDEIKIKELKIKKGLSQQETEEKLRKIGCKNKSYSDFLSFIGGGIKPHYIPSVVKNILSRGEFYTAYTPYQSEASQGFLQAMFEYQSIISEMTGMDISNASLYDGKTAVGEAALMCTRINKKSTFLIPSNISWEKKIILKNYTKGSGIKIKEIKYDMKTGKIDINDLNNIIDDNVSGLYIENPNFFGIFEDKVNEINGIVKNNNSLLVCGVDPLSLGIVKSPGEYDADIVIGEGRSLGNAMDFGGSTLGFFASKKEYIRQIPGRIIGMTKDLEGRKSFCMSLQTREQHIRRGRATSNICTNEGLCSLTAAVYLSWLGSNGLYDIGKKNFENGQKLAKKITKINGFEKVFSSVHFNEFVVKCPYVVDKINKKLLERQIQGGLSLEEHYPDLKDTMLIGITELYNDEDIDRFIGTLEEVI